MYSKEFENALKFVLNREGGYVNDPNDPGGATNKGITQKTYDSWRKSKGLKTQSVKVIQDSEVKEIYYKNYWLAAGCQKMHVRFAVACFDTAVNMGVSTVKPLLEACQFNDLQMFFLARIREYNKRATKYKLQRYLNGWLNRVFACYDLVITL